MYLDSIILVSSSIFAIGIWGVLVNRQNIIILLMSFELMYLAASINFAFLSYISGDVLGSIFLLFVLIVVGAESCIGLALIYSYYGVNRNVSLNTMDLLRN